jgi:hypothetical protein
MGWATIFSQTHLVTLDLGIEVQFIPNALSKYLSRYRQPFSMDLKYVWILKHWNQITNPVETLSSKLKDGLKMCISLRGARATGLCRIGKSSAPGIKQNAKAVRIVLL